MHMQPRLLRSRLACFLRRCCSARGWLQPRKLTPTPMRPRTRLRRRCRTARWSDPAAWPDGKVPGEGDAVTIARDMDVVLDVDPPALRSLTIDGKLSFSDDRDIGLETEWIYLRGGELQIGSEARPYTHNATITLTDNVPDEDINTMGDRGIMLMGGTLNLHGDREHTWTKLARTAAGRQHPDRSPRCQRLAARRRDRPRLDRLRSRGRRSGAPSPPSAATRSRSIAPLEYMHFGEITFGVDERGEVGLLTRNIRIQASDDAESSYFGGHIMAMAGSRMHVSGVELSRMGQHLHLARYPIHWHIIGEGQGQYIRNSAIHDTYSRCVTVHGTNNLRVENNVTFNTVGHCFFLEDAVETGNQFVHNLASRPSAIRPCRASRPTSARPDRAASTGSGDGRPELQEYPDPVGQHRVDVLDHQSGQHLPRQRRRGFRRGRLLVRLAGASDRRARRQGGQRQYLAAPNRGARVQRQHRPFELRRVHVRPRPQARRHVHRRRQQLPFRLHRSGRPEQRAEGVGVREFHRLQEPPRRRLGPRRAAPVQEPAGGRQRGRLHPCGVRGRPRRLYLEASSNSVFVGESDNIGNPRTPQEIAYGRSRPNDIADFPIRGYEYYDHAPRRGEHHLREFRAQRHARCGRDLLPDVHQLRDEHRERHRGREIRQLQAGQFPSGRAQMGLRFRPQQCLAGRGDP